MRYFSTTEAAALLHVDPSRVRLLCKRGRIKTIKVGGTYGIAQNLEAVRSETAPVESIMTSSIAASGSLPSMTCASMILYFES